MTIRFFWAFIIAIIAVGIASLTNQILVDWLSSEWFIIGCVFGIIFGVLMQLDIKRTVNDDHT